MALSAGNRLTVLPGRPLPPGWTGKLWAQQQGVALAEAAREAPAYLLLTDADIVYAPDALTQLVARAERGGFVLTSLMAKLRCESFAERMFVPAFIFFFQMLYPFAWANDPRRATAAAAGGCMLVRGEVLRAAGWRRDPRRPDRRLNWPKLAEALSSRPDFDRADRAGAQHPRLSGDRRHPPHGVAHGLCAAALFAGVAGRDDFWLGADVSRSRPVHSKILADGVAQSHRHFWSGC